MNTVVESVAAPTEVVTNLDRLNELLQDKSIDIPAFRRRVDHSFRNIMWLRRALRGCDNKELRSLVVMSQSDLLKPLALPAS